MEKKKLNSNLEKHIYADNMLPTFKTKTPSTPQLPSIPVIQTILEVPELPSIPELPPIPSLPDIITSFCLPSFIIF